MRDFSQSAGSLFLQMSAAGDLPDTVTNLAVLLLSKPP